MNVTVNLQELLDGISQIHSKFSTDLVTKDFEGKSGIEGITYAQGAFFASSKVIETVNEVIKKAQEEAGVSAPASESVAEVEPVEAELATEVAA